MLRLYVHLAPCLLFWIRNLTISWQREASKVLQNSSLCRKLNKQTLLRSPTRQCIHVYVYNIVYIYIILYIYIYIMYILYCVYVYWSILMYVIICVYCQYWSISIPSELVKRPICHKDHWIDPKKMSYSCTRFSHRNWQYKHLWTSLLTPDDVQILRNLNPPKNCPLQSLQPKFHLCCLQVMFQQFKLQFQLCNYIYIYMCVYVHPSL